ncbi:MAG: hypothetical protein IPL40_06150 [Proteobacteria bacterium]|nr:hypothetical protein [Pseudomonadota bacterium]
MTTLPLAASASRPRLRLERIDSRRCEGEHLLIAYASELELEGQLRSRSPSEYTLWAGPRQVAARPQGATTFAATGEPLQLALVVALGAAFHEAMPALREGAASLVQSLPAGSRLTLLGYTDEVRRLGRRLTPQRARSAVEALSSAERPSDPALVETLALALRSLVDSVAGADPAAGVPAARPQRRVLVVVSDGIDRQPDWEAFRAIGRRARRHGVPIHPLAFSPFDARGPLLNLGELAKRSAGTLRWVRSAGGLTAAFEQLARELNDQLVLTFRWDDCARATPLTLAAGGLRSSAVLAAAGPLSSAGVPARGVPLPWRIVLVVLLVLLLAAGLVLLTRALLRPHRRQP